MWLPEPKLWSVLLQDSVPINQAQELWNRILWNRYRPSLIHVANLITVYRSINHIGRATNKTFFKYHIGGIFHGEFNFANFTVLKNS